MTEISKANFVSIKGLLAPVGRRRLVTGTAALLAMPSIVRAQAPAAAPASAVIDVDRARVEPIPIAIPNLVGSGGTEQLGTDIAGVITNNLARCGLFRPIDPAAFINAPATGDVPNFANWKAIGAQALVTGKLLDAGTASCGWNSGCGTCCR